MAGRCFSWQRALIRAPFVVAGLCSLLASAQAACPAPTTADRTATVEFVYDGDTVLLTSKRKVRFIGINTPERGRKNQPHEPYFAEARNRLIALLKKHDMKIVLQYGEEEADRYQRLLAHAFLPDGTSLGETLLEQGYGFHVAFPPNLALHNCYQAAEERARRAAKGVWSHGYFQPVSAEKAAALSLGGFHFISGRVINVKENRRSWRLDLHKKVSLRIRKQDLIYFPVTPQSLLGKQLTARGWISNRKGKLSMTVRHPAALELKH